MGLVLALMIGSINVAPALARNDHKSYKKYDKGHYNDRYGKRGYYYNHGKRVYRPRHYYGYRERVYYPPPPPVVYAPPPPPGIGIFFPPIFIHP